MDILNIRSLLRTHSIYDIPLRVTFYARVSTDSDEQLNSLDNQISYYKNFIQKNVQWTFIPGYIDEGLSGISTKKRKRFNEMIEDAKDGLFDLIITKEISRFARNTLDSLKYTRDLLSWGVGVFFQNDNINTLDEDAELRLTIMSSIAQDELRKLSSRIKFGHQQAIRSSVVLGNSRIFGYKKDGKRLIIDETEAPMVKDLFRLYATGNYSMKQLEKLFYEQGYRNHNGNMIAHTTMSGIISNPKYKGYYVGNKVRIVDMFTKKQKFLPEEEWVMFKDETGQIVPALVPEDVWEQANEILRRRSLDVKKRQGICNHANLLTGKLYCTHCGTPYYRKETKDKHGNINSKWICSGKIKNGSASCPSYPIYESEIIPILFDVFHESTADVGDLIALYEQIFKSLEGDEETTRQIIEQRKIIDAAQEKKNKLIELIMENLITKENFKSMTDSYDSEISRAKQVISDLQGLLFTQEQYKKLMHEVRVQIDRAIVAASQDIISTEFVAKYIDKIYATVPEERSPSVIGKRRNVPPDAQISLKIKIFTGYSSQKWLESYNSRFVGSMGHTCKKMIESYENSMNANNG